MSAPNMASLLDLPHEVLHEVLKSVDTRDLARLSCSCRALHTFIYKNQPLHRDIYLRKLDQPPAGTDWEEELHTLVKLENILANNEVTKKTAQLPFVAQVVTSYLRKAAPHENPSKNVALLAQLFENPEDQDVFLCNSALFQRARGLGYLVRDSSFEERQASAKLHSLYGVPFLSCGRTRSSRTYPYACSKVYDLRNYTDFTLWGPFREDGSENVDWEKVEAIMVVLGHNLQVLSQRTSGIFKEIWLNPFAGAVPNSYKSLSFPRPDGEALPTAVKNPSIDAMDPYNITGTYMRVVCFLDYSELFAYNFAPDQPPAGEPRVPLDTTEAIRLIVMELRATKISPPGEDDNQALPVVHFQGSSRSMHAPWDPNANSNIRGTVRLTKEGEVRWTTFSIYHGEERWRSEGVQVGGVRSARGVLGNWFDKDFDIHGPAGPTAFWKTHNRIATSNEEESEDEDEDM